MKANAGVAGNNNWNGGNKMLFRFFFTFLSLQTLTETFWGNLFGGSLVIWRLGEKLFVQPCHWLNDHIFHFKYIPQTWTTFSGALHTIRDVVYLTLSFLVCVLWTILDRKRTNYDRLHYWFSHWLIMLLSCITFGYGVIKLFPVQMNFPSFIELNKPVGDLSPFNLIWTAFGYGRPYQVFAGLFEVVGAILIQFRRTRVAGLLVLITILVNVIVVNYTFQVGVLTFSFYLLLVSLFLISPYTKQLLSFLFTKQSVLLYQYEYTPAKNRITKLIKIVTALFIGYSFILNSRFAYNIYAKREKISHSGKYSLVKNYTVSDDTLKSTQHDILPWRIWSERMNEGKNLVTIATSKPGVVENYRIEKDTLGRQLKLYSPNKKDTTPLVFRYTDDNTNNWYLEGIFNERKIKVELERINPDTMLNLLKTRRTLIILDDESDHQ